MMNAGQGAGLRLLGLGKCLPGEMVTNAELARTVDTSDEWITTRTGIRARHFAGDLQNLDLAADAAAKAMTNANVSPDDIGVVLVATFTPDRMSPSVACGLRARLNLPEDAVVFDINAACAGFLYALYTARQLLCANSRPYALVVGSEVISRVLDFADRSTCVLFGDGAAAAVIAQGDKPLYYTAGSRADDDSALYCSGVADFKAAGSAPAVHMHGQEVFRFAVEIIPQCIEKLLRDADLELVDVDYVVCHQANLRIIKSVEKRLGARIGQFVVNLQNLGNTSSASIPLALCDLAEQGKLQPGCRVLCVGFGAGFTWAGCLMEL